MTTALLLMYVAGDADGIRYEAAASHLNAAFWLVVMLPLGLPSAVDARTQREV